jgi:hypothetical protein
VTPPNYKDALHIPGPDSVNVCMYVACMIALFANGRPVTTRMLREHFGMSEKTAWRWARAWREANGGHGGRDG